MKYTEIRFFNASLWGWIFLYWFVKNIRGQTLNFTFEEITHIYSNNIHTYTCYNHEWMNEHIDPCAYSKTEAEVIYVFAFCFCCHMWSYLSTNTTQWGRMWLFLVFLFTVCDDMDEVIVVQVPCYIWRECLKHLLHLWVRSKKERLQSVSAFIKTQGSTICYIVRGGALTSSAENLSAWVVSISVTLWRRAAMMSKRDANVTSRLRTRLLLTTLSLVFLFPQGQRL